MRKLFTPKEIEKGKCIYYYFTPCHTIFDLKFHPENYIIYTKEPFNQKKKNK